uniref:Uncharacterized protein LOC106513154 isoform X1 n=1 Tax=Austrofundulus limnaeus TaxID=52670 RepID=A0A2I4APC1_AUSLI
MDSFEEELAETVRKYSHLYDSTTADYKDIQKTRNSWREIAESLRTEESICRKRWRGLRDRFAKAKRRMLFRTGDPNGNSIVIVPPLFISLQWLDGHVKHREMSASIMTDPHVEYLPQGFQQLPHDHPMEQFLEGPPSPTPQVAQIDGGIDDVEKEPEKDKKELLDSLPVITTIFSAADSSPSSLQTVDASLKRKRQTSTQTEKSSADTLAGLRDEDELFLLSLLPSIKRLSNRKKMEVRMKFQQVLYSAEFENSNS